MQQNIQRSLLWLSLLLASLVTICLCVCQHECKLDCLFPRGAIHVACPANSERKDLALVQVRVSRYVLIDQECLQQCSLVPVTHFSPFVGCMNS